VLPENNGGDARLLFRKLSLENWMPYSLLSDDDAYRRRNPADLNMKCNHLYDTRRMPPLREQPLDNLPFPEVRRR
jgi:hypothetical protein